MLLSGQAHTVAPGEGRTANLGVTQMRVLAAGEATTNGAFTLAEFTGGPGPWTVPHIHRGMEESFYVLDGEFTFAVGEQEIPAGPESYILVPRGTRLTPQHEPEYQPDRGATSCKGGDVWVSGGRLTWLRRQQHA